MTRPAPSEIPCGERDPGPFLGCFDRMEAEVMLALFVLTCRQHGDAWAPQPVTTVIVDEFIRLAELPAAEQPTWIRFFATFGKMPDEETCVEGGWLTVTTPEHPRDRVYEITDRFFERLSEKGYLRRSAG